MKFILPNGESVAHHYFRKMLDADSKARPEAEKVLVTCQRLLTDVDNLEVFSLQKQSLQNLRSAGIHVSDGDFAQYDRLGSEGARAVVRTKLHAQIVGKLGRETEPIARRAAKAVMEDIASDLEAAEAIERRCRERFNTGADITHLRAVLSEVAGEMQRILETPHDLTGHSNPFGCVAASWFTKPIDFVRLAAS